MKRIWSIGLCLFCLFANSFAQQVSTFNNKPVTIDSSGNYSFIISGHFYGDGTNKSGYPANTLLANLDWINESDACMLVCLGDLFMDIKNDLPKYEKSLFTKLEIPLFNAVGNHDLASDIYQSNFGVTYFKFQLENDLHIVLDTELNNGDIKNEQLELLKDAADLSQNGAIKNVFIYGHRTIFKDSYTELDGLFSDNTQGLMAPNFEKDVLPELKKISVKSNLFWFAGSLGDAPASFFYFRDETNKITYIATAIRALLRDAVLIVNVNNDIVSFETKSLTNQNLEVLTHYNSDFWKTTSAKEPFNYRLVPYYIQLTFTSRYFWYGTAFALFAVLTIWWFRRKRRKS